MSGASVTHDTSSGIAKDVPKKRTPLPDSRPAKFSCGSSTSLLSANSHPQASNTTSQPSRPRVPLPDSRPRKAVAGGPEGGPQRAPSPRAGASDNLPARGSSSEEVPSQDTSSGETSDSSPKAAGPTYKCRHEGCSREYKHSGSLSRHVRQAH